MWDSIHTKNKIHRIMILFMKSLYIYLLLIDNFSTCHNLSATEGISSIVNLNFSNETGCKRQRLVANNRLSPM